MLTGIVLLVSCSACTSSDDTIEEVPTVFSELRKQGFPIDSLEMADMADSLTRRVKPLCYADRKTRTYYLEGGAFVWLVPGGVSAQADSLLALLREAPRHGLAPDSFFVCGIADDLIRMRQLRFDSLYHSVSRVAMRLDYRLTQAYLRYLIGQRFGFANPIYLLNHLDPLRVDSASGRVLSYRGLFDVGVSRPDDDYVRSALAAVHENRAAALLRESVPSSAFYRRLQRELEGMRKQSAEVNDKRLYRLLVNMERCRWREALPPMDSSRHVVVNIPAFHLYAYAPDSILDMKVGCGSVKTKTPLLVSRFKRMEVNPVWNIPPSIIRDDVSRHAGDSAYFARNHYYIVERSSGNRMPIEKVTASMLRSGKYRVSQEGGEGNALGRIIFRFDNQFSVFLHDTSSRDFFGRNNRGVSHGCVRVEHPFRLAQYLWHQTDEWQLDRLRISMDMEPQTERGLKYVEQPEANRKLVGHIPLPESVPLYLAYFTLYPLPDGSLQSCPDVYGYDEIIYDEIKPYVIRRVK